MRTIKTILCAILVALVISSCNKEIDNPGISSTKREIVTDTFTIGAPSTKTTLGDGGAVTWEVGDQIVYYSYTREEESGEQLKRKRYITIKSINEDGSVTIEPQRYSEDNFYMFFYNGNCASNITKYYSNKVTMAGVNPDQDGSFKCSNICVANIPDIDNHTGDLAFHNASSLLQFSLLPRTDIKKVSLSGNNNELINGRLTADCSTSPYTISRYGSYTAIEPKLGNTTTSVISSINNSPLSTKPYYFNVMPGEFANGFTMTYYGAVNDTTDYVIGTVATITNVKFEPGHIINILEGKVAATYSMEGASTYNNWKAGVAGTETCKLDEYVTMSAPTNSTSKNPQGVYYATASVWRLYQARGAGLNITSSKTISSVVLTTTATKGGCLKNGSTIIASGDKIDVNGTSLTLTLANDGTYADSKTAGQVNIQSVKVVYSL